VIDDVRTAQQGAQFASLLGAKPAWPSLTDELVLLDEALAAEPVVLNPEERELRAALGLRSHG